MKRRKYGNVKVTLDGIAFDSKAEAARYVILRDMQRKGEITCLVQQVRFVIVPSVVLDGRKRPETIYIADFVYKKDGKTIVEDVKGFRTEVYNLKRKLMKHVHGIEILETGSRR